MLRRLIRALAPADLTQDAIDAHRRGFIEGMRAAGAEPNAAQLILAELHLRGWFYCVTGFSCGRCPGCRARKALEGRR